MCDFGLARHVSSVGSLTGDRGFVGTVDYVAPEQIRGRLSGRTRGPLRTRLCALRVHRRRASVRARQRARGRLRAPERAAAAADGRPARAADRSRPRHRNRDGEVAARPLPDSGRALPCGRRCDRGRARAAACAAAERPAGRGAEVSSPHSQLSPRSASCSRRGDDSAQTPPQITPASIAGATLGLTKRRLQGAVRRRLARRDLPGAGLPDAPLLRPQGRHLLRVSHRPRGRDHDVEQGLQDGGRNRPLLVDRGSEERLRQRAPAVARNTIDGKAYAYIVGHLIFGANGSAAAPVDARDGRGDLLRHHARLRGVCRAERAVLRPALETERPGEAGAALVRSEAARAQAPVDEQDGRSRVADERAAGGADSLVHASAARRRRRPRRRPPTASSERGGVRVRRAPVPRRPRPVAARRATHRRADGWRRGGRSADPRACRRAATAIPSRTRATRRARARPSRARRRRTAHRPVRRSRTGPPARIATCAGARSSRARERVRELRRHRCRAARRPARGRHRSSSRGGRDPQRDRRS